MKVFLSWSGDLSQQVAQALRDWLPSVIQVIEPYVSSEDIDKGARWSTDIAKELEASSYGILCVTPENVDAPWLNFEAGALSKTIDKSFVSPFLFDVKRSDVQGPILQFQSTVYDKDDVRKLIKSLNDACQAESLEDGRLDTVFDVWWPSLKEALDPLLQNSRAVSSSAPQAGSDDAIPDTRTISILEEILDLVRSQQRRLSSPDELLPQEYLQYVFERLPIAGDPIKSRDLVGAVEEIRHLVRQSEHLVSNGEGEPIAQEEFLRTLNRIESITAYLEDRLFRQRRR